MAPAFKKERGNGGKERLKEGLKKNCHRSKEKHGDRKSGVKVEKRICASRGLKKGNRAQV